MEVRKESVEVKAFGEKVQMVLLYLEGVLAGTFLLVMTFCVFLQVFTRYIFQFSYSWPEELARFCFIWASMTGASVALSRKTLHDIDIVFKYFPAPIKPFVSVGSHLLVCTILTVLVVYGIQLTNLVHPQASPAMEIRMSYVYFAVPFSAGLMLITYVCETIHRFAELKSPPIEAQTP